MYHEALSEALPGDNVGFKVRNMSARGAWVAQSVERLTLGSGHDLAVSEFESRVGVCADSSEPGACFRFCVSLCLCPSPAGTLSLCLSLKNKQNIEKNKKYDLLSTCYLPGTVLKVVHSFLTGSLPRACEVFRQAAHSRGHRSPCGPRII